MSQSQSEIKICIPLGKTGRLIFFEKFDFQNLINVMQNETKVWYSREINYVFIVIDRTSTSSFSDILNSSEDLPFTFRLLTYLDNDINPEVSEVEEILDNSSGNIIFLYNDENYMKTILYICDLYLKYDPLISIEELIQFILNTSDTEKIEKLKKQIHPHVNKKLIQKNYSTLPKIIDSSKLINTESNQNVQKENKQIETNYKKDPIPENEIKQAPPLENKTLPTNSIQTKNSKFIESENKNSSSGQIDSITDSPKWSLQIKMMGVISSIFAVTLSIIIFLATYFFKTDNEVRIIENSLRLVNVIGVKVQTDISSIVDKGKEITQTLNLSSGSQTNKSFFINLLFENDPHFIMLGIYKNEKDHLVLIQNVFNAKHLFEKKISEKDLTDLIIKNEIFFLESFKGKSTIQNLSPGFKEKIFSMSLPASNSGNLNTILIMLVNLDKIQSAFSKGGDFETFMVNRNGLVIAHQDEKIIKSGADFSKIPIIQNMQSSAIGNGNVIYKNLDGKNYLGSFKKIGFADSGIITTVSEEKAFQAVYEIQKRNIYIMIISLSASLMIVFFFAKSISKPVLKLLSATLKIAKGDFKVDIVPTTKDEVGVLTNYFIKMGQGLEEREKVKSILGSMIDPTVVKEAMIDMAALKRGSEKKITAFFSDVAGFSTISEQLTSVELASLLNEYLGAMTIILKKYEGVLDKYIGDAIVGIFNAPVDIDSPELNAAKASIDMIQKLKELRAYWTENNLYSKDAQEMDVRIGLNTGLAKVGFMGTDALASYTMMGDTVNLAARLEAAGKDYGVNILISEAMNDSVKAEMFTRKLDLVRVKGKNEPVKIYELISEKGNIDSHIGKSAKLYEEGFEFYLKQDWNSAISKFTESQKTKGHKDKAVKMLIERCEEYKLNPPGKDWDGVFTRTHK